MLTQIVPENGGCVFCNRDASILHILQSTAWSSVTANMWYHQQQYNDMSYYYQPKTQDMSSYIAVQGAPKNDNCNVFGLTQQELRYLRVDKTKTINHIGI